jgi:putative Holliday junction resolvase
VIVESQRFLGVDYGRRRIGIAVSDLSGIIARPLETLNIKSIEDAVEAVYAIALREEVAAIVVGLPLAESGKPTELSEEVGEFCERLEKLVAIPVHQEDERLSSRQALGVLHAHGKKIKGNKEKIDRISAAIVLQVFLDRRNQTR